MDRYSKILKKDKREIVLLIGSGCKWEKCKFCNYYLDRAKDDEKQFEINKEVLSYVTGEFKVLEAINSGSIFELNSKSKKELLETCINKGIERLIIESHYMYKKQIEEFKEECRNLKIDLKIKGGVETFDENFREKVLNKGFGTPSLKELTKVFDEVNLLVGVKGQTFEQIQKDIEIAVKNFERVCINLYKQMPDIMPADEEIKARFIKELYPIYKDNQKVDILIENTDFGVGD